MAERAVRIAAHVHESLAKSSASAHRLVDACSCTNPLTDLLGLGSLDGYCSSILSHFDLKMESSETSATNNKLQMTETEGGEKCEKARVHRVSF
jgi:hypothetical protein